MDLVKLFQNIGERNFHFLANRGNAGDGLIHAGLDQLADRLGLTLDSFSFPEDRRGKNLLVMGAGAFCRVTWHKVETIPFYSQRFENVYILPSSFETTFGPVNRMLRTLPANVTLFCRERISYDAVRKLVPHPEKVFLDHDLAFHLDVTRWNRTGQGELNAFRTDAESNLKRVPSPNFDISNMGREYHHTLLLDTVSHFELINTDRLHIGIAGALLGKKVRLFEGNYHKIRGIYDFSLRDKYPNVSLCGAKEMKDLLAQSDQALRRDWLFRAFRRFPGFEKLRRFIKIRRSSKAAPSRI